MKFYINNHEYEVVAKAGGCVIRTERGEYQVLGEYEADVVEVDAPYIFHGAMCPVYEGQTIKSFEEFEELFFSGSGDEEGAELAAVIARDHSDYDRSCAAAAAWSKVSDEQADVIIKYLEDQYAI